jgi:hypothetical protein
VLVAPPTRLLVRGLRGGQPLVERDRSIDVGASAAALHGPHDVIAAGGEYPRVQHGSIVASPRRSLPAKSRGSLGPSLQTAMRFLHTP